jgi:hypothetical protein
MTARLLYGVVLVFAFACTSSRIVNDGSLYPYHSAVGPGTLHLHCTYTAPYCGGADPGPEGMPRAQPWSGRMFIRAARPDSTGKFAINDLRAPILDTIQMNNEGHGYLLLPAGQYLLLDQDHVDDRRYRQLLHDHAKPAMHTAAIDTACMRRWLHGPFGVFFVTDGDTLHTEYPMHGQCPWYDTPCVSYHGPLPP